jgi:hypothetical protein
VLWITPASAVIGQATQFTIGSSTVDIPSSVIVSLQDCTPTTPVVGGTARARTFTCTPTGAARSRVGYLRRDNAANFAMEFTVNFTNPAPVSTSRLPHTGITPNQCYAAGSNALVSCASPAAIALNPHQDGMRASVNPLTYSRVGSYDLTECVRDDITGLMWEGKTASGMRAGANGYTNYGDGRAGDASAYVASVNASGVCGFSDWRLPTADELQSVVDYSVAYSGPTIAAGWFPNTPSLSWYWSSSPYVGSTSSAWGVYFNYGGVSNDGRGGNNQVRLVRASQ